MFEFDFTAILLKHTQARATFSGSVCVKKSFLGQHCCCQKSTSLFQCNMGSHSQSVNELLDVETEYPITSEMSDLRRKSERSENLKIRKSNIESKSFIIHINEHYCSQPSFMDFL
jgi:hypothetical protein